MESQWRNQIRLDAIKPLHYLEDLTMNTRDMKKSFGRKQGIFEYISIVQNE